MPWTFNPFTGNFDQKGSGGGGASYIDGEVQNFSALPQTVGTPPVDSAYLVREAEGTWLINRKPAGIYIRTANTGTRASDWTHAGAFPDVFNDANFILYDNADSTKNLAFQLSSITTGTTRTLTAPNSSGTIGFLQSVTNITVSTDHQLTAARNQRVLVNSTASGSGAAVYLPATGNAEGDRLEVACVALTSGQVNVRTGPYDYTVSASMGLGTQRTFIFTSGAWTVGTVESHTHSGLGPTFASSDFRITEPSGLATNQLAFSLSGITAGTTRTLTVPNASGRIQVEGQPIGNVTTSTGAFTTLSASSTITAASTTASPPTGTSNARGIQWTSLAGGNNQVGIYGSYAGTPTFGIGAGQSAGQLSEIAAFNLNGITFNRALTAAAGTFTTLTAGGVTLNSGNLVLTDNTGSKTATFDAQGKLSTNRTYDLPDASGRLALTSDIPSGGSKTYAVFTPDSNQPPASNYAVLDTRNSVACLDFDDATDESAVFVGIIPEGASLGSGLKIRLHWAATTATSGDVRWNVSLERMTDLGSDSFDTVGSITTTCSGTSGILVVSEVTLTTIDSVTAGDGFRLKVTRDGDNEADTMSGDCELYLTEVRSAA